jgi:NYN domain
MYKAHSGAYSVSRILPAFQDASADLEWRGFTLGQGVRKRVAVFVDYQNVYQGARSCFAPDSTHHVDGQIDPLRLGRHLAGPQRDLVAVHVYRGMPSSKFSPVGFSAAERQVGMWRNLDVVFPHTRPLNYRNPASPMEKGIDVSLAIGMVMGAIRQEFDTAVLFSADTDLLPAVESLCELHGEEAVEVACWVAGDRRSPQVLRLPGKPTKIHMLYRNHYEVLHDATDYTVKRRRR